MKNPLTSRWVQMSSRPLQVSLIERLEERRLQRNAPMFGVDIEELGDQIEVAQRNKSFALSASRKTSPLISRYRSCNRSSTRGIEGSRP